MPTLLRIIVPIVIAISVFVNFSIKSQAQESLDKARQDYSFQFSKYREIQKDYQSAKSQYESFKTATSKNEAFLKTKDYLGQIDNLLIAYVLLINENGQRVNWQSNAKARDSIANSFQAEISYFEDHKQKVQKVSTLEELPPLAKELNEHLSQITFLKVYRTLASYEYTHAKSTFSEFNKIFSSLDEYISINYPQQNNTVISNWRSEIRNIGEKTKTNLDLAEEKYSKTKLDTANKDEYKEISLYSTKAAQELKKTKILFDEILRIL